MLVLGSSLFGCRSDEPEDVGFSAAENEVAETSGGSAPSAGTVQPAEQDPGWLATVQTRIFNDQFAHRQEGSSLVLSNRSYQLRAALAEDGVHVSSTLPEQRWSLTLSLARIGRSGGGLGSERAMPNVGACDGTGRREARGECLRAVEYRRSAGMERWVNDVKGLEQTWELEVPPAGDGPLELEVAFDGLEAVLEDGGGSVAFSQGGLRYGGLAAWDARGEPLQAWLAVEGSSIVARVDDEEAEWPITVDPVLTTAAWTVVGEQAGTLVGTNAAAAGDVNGDGYGDVIYGAPWYNGGQSKEGKVYLFCGSATGLSTSPCWSNESNKTNTDYGANVAAAGDVNGDGLSDILVLASAYEPSSGYNVGRVYLYKGSASAPYLTELWTVTGAATGDYAYGTSLSTAGDVNGDGCSDFMIGRSFYEYSEADEGTVDLYYGSKVSISGSPSVTLQPNVANSSFGASIASAGDVNGDGYSDIIIGAPGWDSGGTDAGKVYVYKGASGGLNTTAILQYAGTQAGAMLGNAVTSAGDVYGDGYPCVLVGALLYDGGQTDEGQVLLFRGKSGGIGSSPEAWKAEGDQAGARLGNSVSSAGDVNGDGYADVILGADSYDNGTLTDAGKAVTYLGSINGLAAQPAWVAVGEKATAYLGSVATSAGDVNGDGYGDVLVTTPGYTNDSGQNLGQLQVFHGSASILSGTQAWYFDGEKSNSSFGSKVISAGDVDGDGMADVLVAAPNHANGQNNEGKVFLFKGTKSGLASLPYWTYESNQSEAILASISAGDVNGDGYSDVLAGAYLFDSGQNNEGIVYCFLGSGAGPAIIPSSSLELNISNASFGVGLASGGDVNGDGFMDVVVGAPGFQNGLGGSGTVLLYLGSSTGLNSTPVWRYDSQESGTFGAAVAIDGDVNGDGYSDLVVANPTYSGGQTSEGKVTLFLGSASGLSSVSWSKESDSSNATFGSALRMAGDVNGDGLSDVIVGAKDYSNGQSKEGMAQVFLGTTGGLSPFWNWMLEGGQSNAFLGASVASAGDVNADGYSDIIVGASGYDAGSTDNGRCLLYLGSSNGLGSVESWEKSGITTYSKFGTSVAQAGDVNGDGFSDVVVGAPTHDTGAILGRVYLFLGNSNDGAIGRFIGAQGRRKNSTTPIFPMGRSSTADAFDIAALDANSPFGRLNARLQYEVKSGRLAFELTSLGTGSSWTGLTPGVKLQTTVSSLTAQTDYHWRTRILYQPASGVPQLWSRWLYGGISGQPRGVHVRTACSTDMDTDGLCDGRDGDQDGDGYVGGTGGTDCNDSNAAIKPGATEVVADGVDQNCDGKELCYKDADNDGQRPDATSTVESSDTDCNDANEAISTDPTTDCNDTDAGIKAGTSEVVGDGKDQNCDGKETCYKDSDNDGYRVGSTTVASVDADCNDSGEALSSEPTDDCDDGSASIHPGAEEVVGDSTDSNCDQIELCFFDSDNDGYLIEEPAIVEAMSQVDPTRPDCSGLQMGSLDDPTTDCDDTQANVYPGATELIGDGIDQSCDGLETCYFDADGDGYRAMGSTTQQSTELCNGVGEALSAVPATDCNDTNGQFYPGAPELCDQKDNDCDGQTDESVQVVTWYLDEDGDGYGRTDRTKTSCEVVSGYSERSGDCNDTNADVHPSATELTGDSIDQDCDGKETCYKDVDDDGYRPDEYSTTSSADADCGETGEATASDLVGDCDDSIGTIYPGRAETVGDGVDQDCDGEELCFVDGDGDGYLSSSPKTQATTDLTCSGTSLKPATAPRGDCDDTDASLYPSATEVCNGIDDDCDGKIDDGITIPIRYKDGDGDGFGVASSTTLSCGPVNSYVDTSGDCNDDNAEINPGAIEIAGDSVDQNCDSKELCFVDSDDDGYRPDETSVVTSTDTDCSDEKEAAASDPTTDCKDDNAGVNPGKPELVGDGVDQNCDGQELCYVDSDGDGYRSADTATTIGSEDSDCADSGEAAATKPGGDCDDAEKSTNPNAAEQCDGIDNNCNKLVDDNVTQVSWYKDSDGDNYGKAAESVKDCKRPAGYVQNGTDCDDARSDIYPGAEELVGDGIDESCDGKEVCLKDADDDGFLGSSPANIDSVDADCTDAYEALTSDAAGDCADTDAKRHPAAVEVCNEVDEDCDGVADDGLPVNTYYRDADKDGVGDTQTTLMACMAPAQYVGFGGDCNDGDPSVKPGAAETAGDNADQNCDGKEVCFQDADDDGHRPISGGTVNSGDADCDDAFEALVSDPADDCDDTDADVHPLAGEVAGDEFDQNCDGKELCFYDVDGDGYRSMVNLVFLSANLLCSDEYEATVNEPATDCDDSVPQMNPGAAELCNSADDNCNGVADEGVTFSLWYLDADKDGYGTSVGPLSECAQPMGYVALSGDCNDGSKGINPGASEVVGDGVDQNCDKMESCYLDTDEDGYRAEGDITTASSDLSCGSAGLATPAAPTGDCDDEDSEVHPGAEERAGDGRDQDCDGVELCLVDIDGDGFRPDLEDTVESADLDCVDPGEAAATLPAGDCQDGASSVNPGATEVCNALDDDCNGAVDDAADAQFWYPDVDKDGYGASSGALQRCTQPAGMVPSGTDCNDASATTYPGATELVGNELDESCDGKERCYVDADADGYRPDGELTVESADPDCSDPGEASSSLPAGDCDDTDAAKHPDGSGGPGTCAEPTPGDDDLTPTSTPSATPEDTPAEDPGGCSCSSQDSPSAPSVGGVLSMVLLLGACFRRRAVATGRTGLTRQVSMGRQARSAPCERRGRGAAKGWTIQPGGLFWALVVFCAFFQPLSAQENSEPSGSGGDEGPTARDAGPPTTSAGASFGPGLTSSCPSRDNCLVLTEADAKAWAQIAYGDGLICEQALKGPGERRLTADQGSVIREYYRRANQADLTCLPASKQAWLSSSLAFSRLGPHVVMSIQLRPYVATGFTIPLDEKRTVANAALKGFSLNSGILARATFLGYDASLHGFIGYGTFSSESDISSLGYPGPTLRLMGAGLDFFGGVVGVSFVRASLLPDGFVSSPVSSSNALQLTIQLADLMDTGLAIAKK